MTVGTRRLNQRKLTDDQIADVEILRGAGWTWSRLAVHFGVGEFCVRAVMDPSLLRSRARKANRQEQPGRKPGGCPGSVSEDARTKAVQPPKTDTRDLTARLCGDPLPGRSALDRRGDL